MKNWGDQILERLPGKSRVLRRATVFNKGAIEEGLKGISREKGYLLKRVREDLKEGYLFRNYVDYLVSVWLELKGEMERLRPLPISALLSSKEVLREFREGFLQVPNQYRIERVGIFDTETTDLDGYIISFAFLEYKIGERGGELVEERYQLLNPETAISEEAQQVHKIDLSELADKPKFKEIKEEFLKLFQEVDLIVGHNILFDLAVVRRELERVGHFPPILQTPIFDTMYFSIDLFPIKKNPRLEEVAQEFLKISPEEIKYHNALEDTKMTWRIFEYLLYTASL
ncbi:MAG: 3'-5' exonuclease [Campylobacterales bacterium]